MANNPLLLLNPLYQQWSLVGVVFTATVACLTALWFLFQLKAEQTRTAVLEIRSALSRLFQETVAEEALRIFDYVENNLPSALSQFEANRLQVSAFDRLCTELRKIDPINPDRGAFKGILEHILSGIIGKEARRLISQGEAAVGFAYQTEVKLAFLAKKTGQANNHEAFYNFTRKWCFRLIVFAPICALGVLLGALFAYPWCYIVGVTATVLWGITFLLYILTFVVQIKCHNWLMDASKKDCLKDNWQAELAKLKL
jgi:hypothetical protein